MVIKAETEGVSYILGEVSLPDPQFPPYYSQQFFTIFKKARDENPIDITNIKISQWYIVLFKDNMTMLYMNDGNSSEYMTSGLCNSLGNNLFLF